MKRQSPKRIVALALSSAVLGSAALTGCASTGAGGPATAAASPSAAATSAATSGATAPGGTPSSAAQSPGTPSAGTGTGHGSAAPVTLDEGANQSRITVAVGTPVRVDLHSTYWSPVASSDPALLAPAGAPSTAASPSCHPGGGCGTVTTGFVAKAAGTVKLTSSRTTCGEAKPCAPDQQTFTVEVAITG